HPPEREASARHRNAGLVLHMTRRKVRRPPGNALSWMAMLILLVFRIRIVVYYAKWLFHVYVRAFFVFACRCTLLHCVLSFILKFEYINFLISFQNGDGGYYYHNFIHTLAD